MPSLTARQVGIRLYQNLQDPAPLPLTPQEERALLTGRCHPIGDHHARCQGQEGFLEISHKIMSIILGPNSPLNREQKQQIRAMAQDGLVEMHVDLSEGELAFRRPNAPEAPVAFAFFSREALERQPRFAPFQAPGTALHNLVTDITRPVLRAAAAAPDAPAAPGEAPPQPHPVPRRLPVPPPRPAPQPDPREGELAALRQQLDAAQRRNGELQAHIHGLEEARLADTPDLEALRAANAALLQQVQEARRAQGEAEECLVTWVRNFHAMYQTAKADFEKTGPF